VVIAIIVINLDIKQPIVVVSYVNKPNNNYNTNSNNRYQHRSNNTIRTLQANSNASSAESSGTNMPSIDFPYFVADTSTVDSNLNNSTSLLKPRVELVLFNQEPQTVLALIDGGSLHSFISPSILTSIQLKIAASKDTKLFKRQDFQINGATGSAKSSCCVSTAQIRLGQWSGEHEFVISGSVTRHNMIIDRDFFKAHDVIVNHANDSMLVDGLNINLNTIHSISTHIFEDRDDELTDQPPEVSIQEQLKIIHKKLSELTSQKSVVGPI
jgi:hypothetical protein